MKTRYASFALAGLVAAGAAVHAAPKVTTAAGANPADITAVVAAFRADVGLGGAGNTANGPFAVGFRNINWDGTAEAAASPNAMPADFFNNNVRRGAVFTTPTAGATIQVSAATGNASNTAVRFGHIDPSYPARFKAFTEQRLFGPVGSTIVDSTFFVPGSPATPATTNGFGVVFCDVDLANTTSIECFDAAGRSLGRFFAPVADNGLSFVGVFFGDGERVARVRLVHGNLALGAGNVDSATQDVVTGDDYMYGEPLPLATNGLISSVANRARVGAGADVQITGFVIRGSQPKTVLIRAAGPALTPFGVAGALANPQLALLGGDGATIGANDDWAGRPEIAQAAARAGAFPFAATSADAALIAVLNPGSYAVVTSGVAATSGTALTEIYELP
jgi:hypothetical protein